MIISDITPSGPLPRPGDTSATPLEPGVSERRPRILIIDDTPSNLRVLGATLGGEFDLTIATSGAAGLTLALNSSPDLILLDVMMPEMDGYETLCRLKSEPRTRAVPVIFLTALGDLESENKGLALGAVDYITKPISMQIVTARVKTHLMLKAATDFLREQNLYLEQEVARRTGEIRDIQDVTILTIASLAETRDNETGNHILRTQHYVKALALHLQQDPRFSSYLDDETIELLHKSAPLHDIGKVGIPDRILLKPGKLDCDEFEIMKTHTTLGRDAIASAEKRLGKSVPFLRCAKEIAYSHQEKWDGSGYPEGLSCDAIPMSARLMAVADVYDALISRRTYKPPFTHEAALALMSEGSGKHFDPVIVDALIAIEAQCRAIAARYDSDQATQTAAIEERPKNLVPRSDLSNSLERQSS